MQYCIGMFYFTLGNLSPKYRSHLPNIQLVAIAKSTMISSYGMDRILQPFVDDVKRLVSLNRYFYFIIILINCVYYLHRKKVWSSLLMANLQLSLED